MLLQLIPSRSDPTIHFSFSFKDLPQSVNTPPSWANQLSHLLVEELEVPNTVHSFDKAAGITSLLEEVTFDVERGEVRCRFVDGATEEWAFFRFVGNEDEIGADRGFELGQEEGRKLLAALDGVVQNVKACSQEEERSVIGREKDRHKSLGLQRSKSLTVKVHGKTKHKKQRSMFMQFVSSIGSTIANLTSPSSGGISLPSQRRSTSLSLTSRSTEIPAPHHSGRARALRRAARSGLVDAYRRFVLTELVRRVPTFSYQLDSSGRYSGIHGGGFCVWILHSMRRRAQERIDQIVEEAEMVMEERAREMTVPVSDSTLTVEDSKVVERLPEQDMDLQSGGQDANAAADESEARTTVVPLTFNDDDDDIPTETDGSSLRTPSSVSHISYPVRPTTSLSCHSQTSSASPEGAQQLQVPSKDREVLASRPSSPTSPPPESPTSPSSPVQESIDITHASAASSTRPISSTPSQSLSGQALVEYNHLADLRERLWQLAMFGESQTRIATDEVRSRFEILAVRSRRRAWSSGAFNRLQCVKTARCELNDLPGWQSQYGLAMPFRSSPLAKFSWTAEDLQKELEKGRDADPLGDSSSSLGSISATGFPLYQSSVSDCSLTCEAENVDLDDMDDPRPLIEREFELYEEFPGPSPLDLRGGRSRRRRRWETLELGSGVAGVGRLFPVSEELEGEGEEAVDLEFRVALGGAGVLSYGSSRGHRRERTFMGCDEVDVEGDDEEDQREEQIGYQDALVDDDLVDPRELDIELGFGFDFHQKGTGGGFLGHTDEDNIFTLEDEDDDESDEDEFKFDLSAQLERPKIRPRVRTNVIASRDVGQFSKPRMMIQTGNILCQPIVNFASSSNLPLYPTLSKSAPSPLSPRPSSSSSQAHHVSQHPVVLDISRTPSPIYCDPEEAEIGASEYDVQPFPHLNPHHRRLHHSKSDGSVSTSAGNLPLLASSALPPPLPIPLPLGIDSVHDEGQEEFTLAMDLPRVVGGGTPSLGQCDGTTLDKRWIRHPTAPAMPPGGRRLKFHHYPSIADGTLVSPC